LTIHILAAVAEDESRRISTRVREALERFKARGGVSERTKLLYPGGVPAEVAAATGGKLGSHLPQCSGKLTPEGRKRGGKEAGEIHKARCDEAYGDLMPSVLAWRSERLSLRAIAGLLNEKGYETRHGRPWNHVQVMRILRRFPSKAG
jgi:hypothetical protein